MKTIRHLIGVVEKGEQEREKVIVPKIELKPLEVKKEKKV